MFASFVQKFGQSLRHLLPTMTVILFILIGVLAWPMPHVGTISPSLGLLAVYYWGIYRPDLLRPVVVFVLGILNDSVHFLPLGLSAFVFVGAYQLAYAHRRYFVGQLFPMLWSGFAFVCFLAMVVYWIVRSLLVGQAVTILPVLLQFLLTSAIFPLPAWILIKLQRAFLSQG